MNNLKNKVHIVIPMSGIGKRFLDAGYKVPKPLIKVEGKTIIEHVCNFFPGEEKFTFICNSDHLKNTNIKEVLLSIKPKANIVSIPVHKKGPVYAISFIEDLLEDNEEVIVSYCDFGQYWDYHNFLKHTRNRNADGAIVSHKGFHPHMLGDTYYASMRDDSQWLLEIKEKGYFTSDKMNEFVSTGVYYFKKSSYLKKYSKKLLIHDDNIKGEYYVSLIYNYLLEDSLKISIYEIQHMLMWGTPEDLEEYVNWSNYFKEILKTKNKFMPIDNNYILVPLAGKGDRFSKSGYLKPKPLIEVSGKPMVVQSTKSLPESNNYIFVALKKHYENYSLEKTLNNNFKNIKIVNLEKVTEGQAITCSLGLKDIDYNASLYIGATDIGMLYDELRLKKVIEDDNSEVDSIIFTFRNNVGSKNNPHMYGWVKTDNDNNALEVSVKKPISKNPYEDHAVAGCFWFKKIEFFNRGLKNLLEKNIRINNEFYIDSLMNELIKNGLKVKVFEVEHFVNWGTPDALNTFIYWQSFFHKSISHPYELKKDDSIESDKIDTLKEEYTTFYQKFN